MQMRHNLANGRHRRWLVRNLRMGAGRNAWAAGWMLAALLVGFLAYIARMHAITHDAFHEMALFRESLLLGTVPDQEIFSFSPTVHPTVHHEWGTGAVLYFATLGTGLGVHGLAVLKFSTVLLMWCLLYRTARMRGCHPMVFAALAGIAFPVFWVGFATVRAQLFTLLFLAIQAWMQELDWRGRRGWIMGWLVMLIAWLNMHAGFIVGLGMMAFHGLERLSTIWLRHRSIGRVWRDTWHLWAAAPVAALCPFINPYGWHYVPYLMRAIRMDRPLIREWQPLWHTYAPGWTLAMFGIALVFLGYAVWHNPWRRRRGAAFAMLAAWMTVKHIRHGSLFGLIWIAYVPAWFTHTRLGRRWIAWMESHDALCRHAAMAVVAASGTWACYHEFWRPTLPPRPQYSTACFPVQAVQYLKQHEFRGRLFTPFHVGAYVSWEMFPDVLVSFDGRYEVAYQDRVMQDHNAFLDAEGAWWEIPLRYGADAVLVHRQAPVADLLDDWSNTLPRLPEAAQQQLARWAPVYRDDSFLVLARSSLPLPRVDATGRRLIDGAAEAFSPAHSHWARIASGDRSQTALHALHALPGDRFGTGRVIENFDADPPVVSDVPERRENGDEVQLSHAGPQ